jgi:Ni/Fe-hydrogenase subunit HybB-like protein
VVQIICGTLAPLVLLAVTQLVKLGDVARKRIYVTAGLLTLMGIFAMRWNVVIGGQLFSKSFLGYTTYKIGLVSREGLLAAVGLTLLPLGILWVLIKLLPPWSEEAAPASAGD